MKNTHRPLSPLASSLKKKYYLSLQSLTKPGTAKWLIGTEMKYGGMITNVPRNKVSPHDPRTKTQLKQGGMTGGDRMHNHGYAKDYARYLLPFINSTKAVTLAEFGILKGSGLAIWCDLFKKGTILGFDIDLTHFRNNLKNLKQLGAFEYNQPHLYELDQFVDNTKYLGQVLKNRKLDICIDDGFHADQTILKTLKSIMPYLTDDFVYFIEDNQNVHKKISTIYPNLKVDSRRLLTILSRRAF